MAGSWQAATGGNVRKMEKERNTSQRPATTALAEAEQAMDEFHLEGAALFDHAPVLRIQVSDAQFARALQVREALVERIKPLGYRFISLDLDELTE